MKIGNSILFQKKQVALGKGHVDQYILFENKHLFTILFYRWNTIDQIRFHTHAFSAVAFLLSGWYWEKVMFNKITMTNFVSFPFLPRFIPKNYCHAIENAKPNTITMVITGPWQKHWYEYFPDTEVWVKYNWGRKKIGTYKDLPDDLSK